MSGDDYTADIFRTRGISPDVAEERGYRQYLPGDVEKIFAADERLRDEGFAPWVRKYAATGGWLMPKNRILGSPFPLDPLPQLRPDMEVPGRTRGHDHDGMQHRERDCPCGVAKHKRRQGIDTEGRPWVTIGGWLDGVQPSLGRNTRELHELGKNHKDLPVAGPHKHVEMAKYALAPGPHGKRWDTHPRCDAEAFGKAARVFLHLEGTLKLDSLVSAGEVGIDVPSVTLWRRDEDDLSEADYPDDASGFWREYRPQRQTLELTTFLDCYGGAPIIVVCDADWHRNPAVAIEAFCLRDVVRAREIPCTVAAPPRGLVHEGKEVKGSDDFFYAGGTPDKLRTVEPTEPPALDNFAWRYGRRPSGASGRRSPAETVAFDLEVLRWLSLHSAANGYVKRPAATIAGRLGVSDDAVYKSLRRLIEAGAIEDDDAPLTPIVNKRLIKDDRGFLRDIGRGHEGETPTLRLREDLRPRHVEGPLAAWCQTAGRRPALAE